MLAVIIGTACLLWYFFILLVSTIGYVQIYRHYRRPPARAVSESLPLEDIPHVTIIRPVKGLEPCLYQCLAATFHQSYPPSKLMIFFCISDRDDPALPVLQRLVEDFPAFDASVLIEEDDPALQDEDATNLGPNPKIRNMSRAYREARGDLIWIIDCNVWVSKGVAGRMVDTICGFSRYKNAKTYKFVHQLPLTVDITAEPSAESNYALLTPINDGTELYAASTSTAASSTIAPSDLSPTNPFKLAQHLAGGRLDELFLSTAHAKFYTAINTVAIAPCIVGKSNMFRKSDLDALTSSPQGIDHFSHNICEDHLIGDLLWKHALPTATGNHALLPHDLAIQPVSSMQLREYLARRTRWLRVRKFTVPLATLVEPGTESLLCCAYGAFGATSVPWSGVPGTWTAFAACWVLGVVAWAAADWTLHGVLMGMACVEVDGDTPDFARGLKRRRRAGRGGGRAVGEERGRGGRPFGEWLAAWVGREVLALPIWLWAVFGGATVVWRGQKFRVGMDMRVHAVGGPASSEPRGVRGANGMGKARRE